MFGAHLAADHSLVNKNLFRFISRYRFSFCFLLLDLVVELEFCHRLSPACKSCLFILIHNEFYPMQTKMG